MTTIAKTRAIGGSLVVTIPIQIVKSENIQEGEFLEIDIRKRKKDFFGALKGIGEYTREDRMADRE